MSNLPSGWTWATLEDLLAVEDRAITDGPFGSKLASRHYTTSGARVIRLQNIGDCIFNNEHAYISLDYFEELRAHEVRSGDLVIASLGQDLPRACIVPTLGEPAIVKADCVRVRIHPEIDPRWVLYALSAPQTRQRAASRIRGVGRPRLGLGEMRKLPIPLPPQSEQRRIVATLEDHLSRLEMGGGDLLIADKRMSRLWQSALNRVAAGEVTASKLAQTALVGQIAEVQGGIQKQPKRRPVKNKYPFLRVANVPRGNLDLSEIHEVELFDGELDHYRLRMGDLLVVEGNGSPEQIGRAAMWRDEIADCVHQNHLIRVRPAAELDPRYLELVWNAPATAEQLRRAASSTSGLHTLSTAKIKSIQIPVPPIGVQESLAAEADRLRLQIAITRGTVRQASQQAEALRRSLLMEAFRGKLAAQDSADAPSSALLERIRAERAMQPQTQRRGRAAKGKPQEETLL